MNFVPSSKPITTSKPVPKPVFKPVPKPVPKTVHKSAVLPPTMNNAPAPAPAPVPAPTVAPNNNTTNTAAPTPAPAPSTATNTAAPTPATATTTNNTTAPPTTTTTSQPQQQDQQQSSLDTSNIPTTTAGIQQSLGALPTAPKITKPATVAAARTEGSKLLSKCSEIGRELELEIGATQGIPLFKAQREKHSAQSANVVSTLSNLKANLDKARWQRLQYGSIAGSLGEKVTDVKDRVEDEEARVAANPVDKAKNIASSRASLLRELAMRREVFTICAKWATAQQQTRKVENNNNSTNNANNNNSSAAAEQSAENNNNKTETAPAATAAVEHVVDIRTAELELAIKYAEEWAAFAQKARATLQTVDSDSHQLHGVEGSVPAAEQGLLAQCDELIKQHGVSWLREGQRRKNYDASLKAFFADHTKLMQWCRQRLATLSGLTQAEHIQEFCASFRNSTAVMGSNLLVLLESSSSLIPNKEVERALLDISETWLGLETFAYERLRTTLLEQHSKSGLEAEARAWPEYSKKLINSLTEAQRLLNETNDASSAKLLASLKDSCAQLIQDHDAHLLIVEHLADFSVREECLSDHYRALRAMIFSRITMLCQTFAGLSFPRRAEYSDCVSEASAWVESKTKSEAWQDMLERVEHIRVIIEKSDGSTGEN